MNIPSGRPSERRETTVPAGTLRNSPCAASHSSSARGAVPSVRWPTSRSTRSAESIGFTVVAVRQEQGNGRRGWVRMIRGEHSDWVRTNRIPPVRVNASRSGGRQARDEEGGRGVEIPRRARLSSESAPSWRGGRTRDDTAHGGSVERVDRHPLGGRIFDRIPCPRR